MLLAVGVFVVVAVVTVSVATGPVEEAVNGVVSLVLALAGVNPAGARALALSSEFVVGAEAESINRAATGVFGFVLGARRGPWSAGRVPTLTPVPQ